MSTPISIPNDKFFQGKPMYHFIRTYLEQTIDAEWKATCCGDSTYSEWLDQFHIGFQLDYMVVSGHINKDELIDMANTIRATYDWNIQHND